MKIGRKIEYSGRNDDTEIIFRTRKIIKFLRLTFEKRIVGLDSQILMEIYNEPSDEKIPNQEKCHCVFYRLKQVH